MFIMENINYDKKVFRELSDFYSYTEKDLAREVTEEQLKELCLRQKCRVLMHRWNPVEDMARNLRRKGRWFNKTIEHRTRFLAKCVNHYKPKCLYTEEEIRPVLREEWRQRKKLNLLRLELWDYQRQCAIEEQKEKIDNENRSVQNESRIEQILNDSGNYAETERNDDIHIEISSPLVESENESEKELIIIRDERNDALNEFCENTIIDTHEPVNNTETLPEDRPTILSEFLEVATESMNITLTPSLDILYSQQSQYDEFGAEVPCTSTQAMIT